MSEKNWEAELKKIDKQLETVSDEALLPAKNKPTAAAREQATVVQRETSTLGVMARLVLSVVLAVAMLFWPYDTRCGPGLLGYLGATALVASAGVWTAAWTWRHRSVRGHVVSLVLMLWGVALAAAEVLPRIGYAAPTAERPATWMCP